MRHEPSRAMHVLPWIAQCKLHDCRGAQIVVTVHLLGLLYTDWTWIPDERNPQRPEERNHGISKAQAAAIFTALTTPTVQPGFKLSSTQYPPHNHQTVRIKLKTLLQG